MAVMPTHDDAIRFFRSHGIAATRRRWNLGDCVVVPAFPVSGAGDIQVYEFVAWLVPRLDGGWDLVQPVRQHERRLEFRSLEVACYAALSLILLQRPIDPCPNCGGILDVRIDEKNLGSTLSWSANTSCRSCGIRAESKGRGPLPDDLRRLELARSGTWAVVARDDLPPAAWRAIGKWLHLDQDRLVRLRACLPGSLFEGTLGEALALQNEIDISGGAASVIGLAGRR
jgi:hypothetical protein